jgi:hypothetical protein
MELSESGIFSRIFSFPVRHGCLFFLVFKSHGYRLVTAGPYVIGPSTRHRVSMGWSEYLHADLSGRSERTYVIHCVSNEAQDGQLSNGGIFWWV